MILLRRVLAIAGLAVWQGGFIFYIAVVVPIGTEVLGSATEQGFITRQVTSMMNRCGAFALALLAWDLATSRDPRQLRRIIRIGLFISMVAAVVLLFGLHDRLEALLDVTNKDVVDRHTFRPLHRTYLWISTGQFSCAILYLVLTLAAWRSEDCGMGTKVQ